MQYDRLCDRLKRYSARCIKDRLDPDFADAVKEAVSTIDELEKDVDILNDQVTSLYWAVPKWIPVAEELPEPRKKVLINSGNYVGIGSYTGAYWRDDYHSFVCVKNWMPLPEPARGSEA